MGLLGLKCKTNKVSKYNSYKGQVGKVVDKENHKAYYERNFYTTVPNQVWCTNIIESTLSSLNKTSN